MCTAISYSSKKHYFGRNLDLEYSYDESVTITPRNFALDFARAGSIKKHYAMIGMAHIEDNYPLYYDATNEKGLSMAGLSFEGYAQYAKENADKTNVAVYEFIPWVLSQCDSVETALELIKDTNLIGLDFNDKLKATPLHFMLSDKDKSVVLEPSLKGLRIYDNPVGVLTNAPDFEYQMTNLSNYMNLSSKSPINTMAKGVELKKYSKGMGAIGLPGDLSSPSRFVRATFVKMNSIDDGTENGSVQQFFHILSSVEQQRGCVCLEDNKYEITIYSSCVNTKEGIYYYTDYNDRNIKKVVMTEEKMNDKKLINYMLKK